LSAALEPPLALRILRRQAVLDRIGVSTSTLQRLVAAGAFPRPVRLSTQLVGWYEDQVDQWLADRRPRVAQPDAPLTPLERAVVRALASAITRELRTEAAQAPDRDEVKAS
jgi:prophage regulatory protein